MRRGRSRVSGRLVVVALVSVMLSGCGAVSHEAKLLDGYVPQPGTLIEVGQVANATGRVPKVDDEVVNVERMLGDALTEKLRDKFPAGAGAGRTLILNSQIIEYEPGDAFKRWLLPGWGSTVLAVECELREGDLLVATLRARRTVSIGGAYTIGAWRTVFASLAHDVVSELRAKFPKQ